MNKQPNSYHCFICGVKNIAGVQVAFYETVADDGTPEILARFTARDVHQGYPGRMHGGVATGILDETIGRAINIGAGEDAPQYWGVTADIALRFYQPVPLDVELVARGRITKENRRLFEGTGELYLPDGTLAVSASGKYFKMTLDAISTVDPAELGWRVYND
ncbi:MAG: PaaI family thioesterase [Caldilineaceae bacterium]